MNYIDSFNPLQSRRLTFYMDANGVVHLQDNFVSRVWLNKHYPTFIPQIVLLSYYLQPFVPVIDCTSLDLKGNEKNDLIIDDFEGGMGNG